MKDEFLEQLNAYADGELSEKDRQRVEEHLAACPECRAAYEEILELKALMGEAKTPQAVSYTHLRAVTEAEFAIKSGRMRDKAAVVSAIFSGFGVRG